MTEPLELNLPPIGDWAQHAACKGTPTRWWYPNRGDDTRPAKQLCQTCPVRTQCYETALQTPARYDHGIWGGTSKKQRNPNRTAEPTHCRRGHQLNPDGGRCRQCQKHSNQNRKHRK